MDEQALLDGARVGPPVPRDGTLLGALFESLVALSVRVFAQAAEARVHHLRTKAGEREIDFIVVRPDQRVVAIEVKLAQVVGDADVRHLHWLAERLGEDLLSVVASRGPRPTGAPTGSRWCLRHCSDGEGTGPAAPDHQPCSAA